MLRRNKKRTNQRMPGARRRHVASPYRQAPTAFMYRSARSEEPVLRGRHALAVQERRHSLLKFWVERIGFVVGAIVVGICAVQLLALSGNPKVEPESKSSAAYFLRDPAVYQRAAARLLGASVLNSTKVTVNTKAIADKLKNQFPELNTVAITVPLIGHRPIVYVDPAKPAFILQSGADRSVIDQNGRDLIAADDVAYRDTLQQLPVIIDRSGLQTQPGATVLPSTNVQFMKTVLYELEHGGVKASKLELPSAASEFDVYVQGQPYYIKFSMQSDTARQQAGTFLAVKGYVERNHITVGEYIDVRVDGRAYYK